jgi:hypothetical protein
VPPGFFSGIKTAATSPYALIAYICVLAAWVYITIVQYRLKRLSTIIAKVPEHERAALLAREYSTFPRAGLSAEQWIRSRKHQLFAYAVIALIAAATVVAVTAILTSRQSNQNQKSQAFIKPTVKTRIVSRLYTRAPTPKAGQTANASPSSQEIFYEWSVSLTSIGRSGASLKANYLQENDIFRVDPEEAKAERVPEWSLGFKVRDESKPDYYALIVRADDLSETQPLTVTIRRSISLPVVESDLIRLADVRSTSGQIEDASYDAKTDLQRLKFQAGTIAQWKWTSSGEPLEIHPSIDVPPGYMQSTVETWCKDEDCKEMTIGNLVGKWNRLVVNPIPHSEKQSEASKENKRAPKQAAPSGTFPKATDPYDIAKKRLDSDPERLTIYDLFLTDFEPSDVKQARTMNISGIGPLPIAVGATVVWQVETGSEFIMFYVPYTNQTKETCFYLAGQYQRLLEEAQKFGAHVKVPGESEQTSSKALVFSNRIFVYHETYLSPEQIIEVRNLYKSMGITILFRSTDYLANRKLEAKVKNLQKVQK